MHAHDDDFGQAGTVGHQVLDDRAPPHLVDAVADHLGQGVREPVLGRAIDYGRNVDVALGAEVAKELSA